MNWPKLLASSPVGVVLLRWTALLALGWVIHWLLRKSHPRWRLILWRGMLCLGVALPLVPLLPTPFFSIAVPIVHTPEINFVDLPVADSQTVQAPSSSTRSTAIRVEKTSSSIRMTSSPSSIPGERGSRSHLLLMIWVLGVFCGTIRLIRFQMELSRLRNAASLAGPTLQKLARDIRAKLGVQRTIEIRISDSIVSPFICGPLKPIIMLPQTLARTLSSVELSALLAHEIAHFRQRDLVWCVGWRWMQAICWFHPLVWNVPGAHNLACEEEADRIAAGQFADRGSYAQWLARLALRVLALPNLETELTLNGTAQIVQTTESSQAEGSGHLEMVVFCSWNGRPWVILLSDLRVHR
jgi:beta-lactamase regulating signal transducer with metallopeptidase domain